MESLEDRTLLAGLQILQIVPNDGVPLQNNDIRNEAPTELTFLFSPGESIDPTSLDGIEIVRSGFDGVFGDVNDVAIAPGFAGVGNIPNEAVVRFAETLPDDNYQITIFGSGATPLLDGSGQAYNNGVNTIHTFELDLGAQIIAVNPQPIIDDGSGMLVQNSDQIVVHFNNDELDTASAENPLFYQLIDTQGTIFHTDDVIQNPQTVVYDNVANTATLTFATDIADGTYRLRIGISDEPSQLTVNVGAGSDDNSSFDTATELSTPQNTALGNGDLLVVNAGITNQNIALPPLPGGLDEPGHRQIPLEAHVGSSGTTPVIPGPITQIPYNFQDVIGVDPSGNTLFNLITEEEKQRAREIFEIYSHLAGIEFIETDFSGILVATGDMRAVDPALPVGPGGVAGVAGGGKVVMDPADTPDSTYGGSWMGVALHEIGHAIGLGHSYDIPSIQGGGLTGEPVFPGDHDIVHLLRLWRNDSTDIDLYEFEVTETGVFTAEIFAERLATPSLLNSALTLYRENPDGSRDVIARNDDYFSNDSYLELELDAGTYYVGVTSTGNVDYDPNVSDTGSGGTTDGNYELRLNFQSEPAPGEFLVDTTGTAFDGDADGKPGGVYEFWFDSSADTIFVDKSNAASTTQDGSLADPYSEIDVALSAVTASTDIIRILGNGGADDDLSTPDDALPYLIGLDDSFQPLQDGKTFVVPQDVTVVIDAGAVLKLQSAVIDVGSSSDLVDRGGAALQILGTPDNRVFLTSFGNDALGGDTDGPVADGANPGDWGGIVYRADSDYDFAGVFLNHVGQADLSFGGGQVFVDSILDIYNPIHAVVARPTISFNTITFSADSAISADPNSFDDTIPGNTDSTLRRIGPDIHGNVIVDNSLNGLFVRVETLFGKAIDKVDVPARFDDTDVVHIITENIQIEGNPGGPTSTGGGPLRSREAGRLRIDPGIVVKLSGSRIEGEHGHSNLIAEGTPEDPIIFTSIFDDRFGRGGTFDTSNDAGTPTERGPLPGDWGGIVLNSVSRGNIDHSLITFAGGQVPIEGNFDNFNAIEVHQARFRMTNTRLEDNADGRSVSNRNGRGGNDSTTVFVRGSQPIIVDNLFIGNEGSVISVNANSMKSDFNRDPGRSTGPSEIIADRATGELIYTDNRGPLVRENRFEGNGSNGMEVRGEELTIESVWDDADIVHVVRSEILSANFHTYGGVRLESLIDTSLVVKLDGPNAGFTAGGFGLDIDDRMGGVVQVVGQPLHPVVLTSLADDTVGAGFRANGQPQNDTNGDGSASTPQPGDWRSIRLEEFSYDRNVEIVNERERPILAGSDVNRIPQDAQFLGELAPKLESGDENRRLGFEIHGYIASDDPADVDVYSFDADAGTQVWFDIDRTDPTLNTVIELLNPLGNVLARSSVPTPNNNNIESFVVGGKPAPIVGPLDADPGDFVLGNDYYTSNPHDAGFRVVLPGNEGLTTTYFVRVRSFSNDLSNLSGGRTTGYYELDIRLRETDEQSGSTIRSSDIRYATNGIEVLGLPAHSALVSEAGEAGDASDTITQAQQIGNLLTSDRNTISVAGRVDSPIDVDFYQFELDYDLVQAIGGVNAGGKTWSTIFDIDYADGLSRPDTTVSVFDANGNLILVSRDSNIADDQPRPTLGNDFGDEERGTAGKLDPFIGSAQMPAGVIPAGSSFTYFVAVSHGSRLPSALNATFNGGSTNTTVRLEPVNSVQRIAEDHIGFNGYTSGDPDLGTSFVAPVTPSLIDMSDTVSLSAHVTPFTLGDVQLFVHAGNSLFSINPLTGETNYNIGQINGTGSGYGDIAMRWDGVLFGQTNGTNNANSGNFRAIDLGSATQINLGDDGLGTNPNVGGQWDALAFRYNSALDIFETFAVNNESADDDNNATTPAVPIPPDPEAGNGLRAALHELETDTGVAIDQNLNVAGFQAVRELRTLQGFTVASDRITGLAFSSITGGTLLGVDNRGRLYNMFTGSLINANVTGTGVGFVGLTNAPQNLRVDLDANGTLDSLDNLFFASTTNGRLYAFDASGNLANVWDTNGDNVADSPFVSISSTGSIALSTLDYNLWHPTMNRRSDPGHGINPAFDVSRDPAGTNISINGRSSNQGEGGASFYFGMETFVINSTNTYFDTYGVANAQYGVQSGIFQEVATNDTRPAAVAGSAIGGPIRENYNFPGGAQGSLTTDSFSLFGYDSTDRPTLYFNYFLDTQGANSRTDMLDGARVFISTDGGTSYSLLATNNSIRDAELPELLSVNHDYTTHPQQTVQELSDNVGDTDGWRQARVDLGDFAGQPNLNLRFDFTTAGSFHEPGDGNTNDPSLPSVAQTGDLESNTRGRDNAFEGFYIDDIIIGFAERGEMVTNATTGLSSFFTTPDNPDAEEVTAGAYQLEIRRGTEYTISSLGVIGDTITPIDPNIQLFRQLDTNDRLDRAITITAPAGSTITDGDVFTITDDVQTVEFEFDNNFSWNSSRVRVPFSLSDPDFVVANRMATAINGTNTSLPNLVPDFKVKATSISTSNLVEISGAVDTGTAALPVNLTVSIAPASISENGGTTTFTVTREGSVTSALNFTLADVDPGTGLASDEVTIAGGPFVIPAGSASETFTINADDDAIADGTQSVLIRATAPGFTSVIDMIDVTDDETPTLTVSINGLPAISESAADGHPGVVSAPDFVLDNSNDGSLNIPIGFTFDFYGTSYTDLYMHENGLITFNAGPSLITNTDLTNQPLQPTIAPLWDDWRTNDPFGNDAVYAAVIPDPVNIGFNQLVVRWEQVGHFLLPPTNTATFEAVLSEFDDSIQFNYIDLDVGFGFDDGASATVGLKDAGLQGPDRLLISFDGSNPLVASGQSIRLTQPSFGVFIPGQATVTRNTPVNVPLTVTLTSHDLTEATVPATVTIPAFATSANFTINPVDDQLLDGDQSVSITATAYGFASGSDQLTVLDDATGDLFTPQLNTGTDFESSRLGLDSSFIPPDTMGTVGTDHIVEMINGNFEVFDKAGNTITGNTITLDQFWTGLGIDLATDGRFTFDPRVLFDPVSGRYIATSIDRGPAAGGDNEIYIAVTDAASDPSVLGNWTAFQFTGDTTDADDRFNDFDMLGIDADGIYITTNNFEANLFADVSFYVISRADLFAATPALVVTAFENQDANTFGFSPQPIVNYNGNADNQALFLSASGGQLILTTIDDVDGSGGGPTIAASPIFGSPFHVAAPQARQPGPDDNIENVSPRFTGNVIQVGNSIWAAHAVRNSTFNGSAVRWYEIDATTNFTLQSGLIEDPTLDFFYPSIAVNSAGDVVIGFSGSGPLQFVSTFAVSGTTTGGVTTFGPPQLLQPGAGTYFVDFGSGRNRWGDYSATVVDPSDPDTFWTFQEFVSAEDIWAIQITELQIGPPGDLIVSIDADSIVKQPFGFSPATVTRTGDTSTTLVVSLSSSDTSEATVPGTVTIPAGSASATFNVTAVNDTFADGTQTVFVTATALDYNSIIDAVDVEDNEPPPRLTATITPGPGGSISETAGLAAATITVSRPNVEFINLPLTVFLTSSDTSEITVQAIGVIPSGEREWTFDLNAIDELASDGTRNVIVFATAPGFDRGSDTITVNPNASSNTVQINRLGDGNLDREQGQLLIQGNTISNVSGAAINIGPSPREAGSNLSHPGAAMNLPTLNPNRLAPGAVIQNNVIHNFGQAGIVFAGDPNTGNVSNAVVPFGKIYNNTIYGGTTPAGIGVQVANNASPTLLNNIVANTATAVAIDGSSSSTVVGTTLFQGNSSIGTIGSNFILLGTGDPLFVDPATDNFYLVDDSLAIDSSLTRLADRPAIVNVKSPLFIPPSDIFAPLRDVRGQLRVDDPSQAPPPGLGFQVFADRGAIERADFVGPIVRLIDPEDNDFAGLDVDPDLTEVFLVAPVNQGVFELQFIDQIGIGVDDASVVPGEFELRRSGTLLTEGTDYFFSFNANNDTVRFISPEGAFPNDVYTIDINNDLDAIPGPGVRDLAGNSVRPNQTTFETRFTVVLGPEISIDDVAVDEGNSGITTFTFTVSLSAASAGVVTVDVETSDDTARVADGDYLPLSTTTITFNPGEVTQSFSVDVVGDTNKEPDETFFVELSNPSPTAIIGDAQGVGTIVNDDLPSFSVSDVSMNEGDTPDTTDFEFFVSVSELPLPGQTVSVELFTSDGTATVADNDYVSILPGTPVVVTLTDAGPVPSAFYTIIDSQTVAVPVTVIGDFFIEPDETFFVNLANNTGISRILDGQGVGTILNDEPMFSVDDVSVTEGNAGSSFATFTVTASKPSLLTMFVEATTSNGTAFVSDNDYVPLLSGSTVLQFDPGDVSKTFTVEIVGDLTQEPDETFFVNLSNPVEATIADGQGFGTIIDDDRPIVSIGDAQPIDPEGDVGFTNAVFTVSLSKPGDFVVTVDVSTADDTATGGVDYQPVGPLTLTFPVGGPLTQTVLVPVFGDTVDEFDETFFVNLSNLSGAILGDDQGFADIINDDDPEISINDVVIDPEGNSGTQTASFTIAFSNNTNVPVTYDVFTSNGSATAPSDYVAIPLTTFTFNPGDPLTRTVDVTVNGDTMDEIDETFFVNIVNAPGATIVDGQGQGTIVNDDDPTISIGDAAPVVEGNSGTINAVFTVSLSSPSIQPVTVNVQTANGTATAAGNDFNPLSTSVTFTPGQLTRTVTVAVQGDLLVETDETFFVNLSGPTNATIADGQGQGVIINDDFPTISVSDAVAVVEGNSGTRNAVFLVSLSVPTFEVITVDVNTQDGTATVADNDYQPVSTTLTFSPGGPSTQPVNVPINGDLTLEDDENFFLNLSNPTFSSIADGQGIGTILNDDLPLLSIGDAPPVIEGNFIGTTDAVFTVTLSQAYTEPVTVEVVTLDGTARVEDGNYDYVPDRKLLTFLPGGPLTQEVRIAINGDPFDEVDEIFFANLENVSNAIIIDGQGVATIVNDDNPRISVNDAPAILEGNSGVTNAVFTVSLSNVTNEVVTVDVSTADDSATLADNDYVPLTTTLTFTPGGPTTQTVNVAVRGDEDDEFNETFFVNLSNPTNSSIGDGQGLGTIVNDDNPTISISDALVNPEGNTDTTNADFTISLSKPTNEVVTVVVNTFDLTATVADNDYLPVGPVTLTFNPGDPLTQVVSVPVVGDSKEENDELFLVDLSNPTNATINDGQGLGTIIDDDSPLVAMDGQGAGGVAALTQTELSSVVNEAIGRWLTAGLTQPEINALSQLTFQVVDLDEGMLGLTTLDIVSIDEDAAGWGWFIDSTPADDLEFTTYVGGTEYTAGAGSPAAGQMDLLTAVMHELGHVLNYSHNGDPQSLMSDTLPTGTRRSTTSIHSISNTGVDISVPDLQMGRNQLLTLGFADVSQSGAALSYSAEVVAGDPVATLAYELDRQYNFSLPAGAVENNYWYNYRGAGEKYLAGFFIKENGDLYRWGSSIANSTLIATLDARYHQDPSLLVDAQAQAPQTGDPAYDLDRRYNFSLPAGAVQNNYWYNYRGAQEKYLAGFFIKPGGGVYKWGGSIAGSTLVGTVDTRYYENPSLLVDVPAPAAPDVSISVVGSNVVIAPAVDYSGQFQVTVTASDGTNSGSDTFSVAIVNNAPQLAAIDDQAVTQDGTLEVDLAVSDADDDELDISVSAGGTDAVAQLAYDLDLQYNFSLPAGAAENDYWYDFRGAGEKYLAGFFIKENGELYRWGSSIANSKLIATLDDRYHEDPSLLVDAAAPQSGQSADPAYQLDQQYNFSLPDGAVQNNYWYNYRGAQEKYLAGFFIKPNGDLYKWGGSFAGSTLIGTVDTRYYDNPSLLVDVEPPAAANHDVSIEGSKLVIVPAAGFVGQFEVTVTVSDGEESDSLTFMVTVKEATQPDADLDTVFAGLDVMDL